MSMETSQALSIESFSYRWLVNLSKDNSLRPSFDGSSEEASSFIEMDPRMPPSKRFFVRGSQDFKFDFPVSEAPLTLLHADELFSNGYVTPIFLDQVKMECFETPKSSLDRESTLDTPKLYVSEKFLGRNSLVNARCSSLKRCKTFSKRLLNKYLDFVKPLFQRIQLQRSRSSCAVSSDRKTLRRVYSAETSPRISVAYSVENWRKSCDSDGSIYEAVLHCKRSIGK